VLQNGKIFLILTLRATKFDGWLSTKPLENLANWPLYAKPTVLVMDSTRRPLKGWDYPKFSSDGFQCMQIKCGGKTNSHYMHTYSSYVYKIDPLKYVRDNIACN
jgi:hypothetical protein